MSNDSNFYNMRTARRNRRLGQKHTAKLGDILNAFYSFLGRNPRPEDWQVREYFIQCRTAWTQYANQHGLDKDSINEFTRQVSLVWHKRQEESTDE